MQFNQIHFCAELISEEFTHSNWFEKNLSMLEKKKSKNRRLGLFKNILISQNEKDRLNKWEKNKSGGWVLTHRSGRQADNSGNYTQENGYSVQFIIEQEMYVIELRKDGNEPLKLEFQANWQESVLEDFENGRQIFLQENPESTFVVERFQYKSYINFISSLFSSNENEFTPYHKTYLALFAYYNENNISERTKAVIQTTMGAMIFYMPQRVNDSWSKRISHKCFLKCVREGNKKKVKDHEIPRKLAAKLCLERDEPFTLDKFSQQYWCRFSSFTYVTSEENMRLVNWYLDENNQDEDGNIDYPTALNNLDIHYYSFPENYNHRHINNVINAVKQNNLNTHIWTPELEEFISNQIM